MTASQSHGSGPAIVWFRQDLRLADNPALAAANGRPVIPLYILDETEGTRPMGGASRWWLDKSLRALGEAFEAKGSKLILRRGPAGDVLAQVMAKTGADTVYWNRVYDPAGIARDKGLKFGLTTEGGQVVSCNGSLLNEPWEVQTGGGTPYKVFTPYWRAARNQTQVPPAMGVSLSAPDHWPATEALDSWNLHPQSPDWSTGFSDWQPGEAGAQAALDAFLDERLADYTAGRDRPGEIGTSRLSPHLHFGEIGPRQVWRAVERAVAHGASHQQADKFLAELGWREFNHHLLFHFPHLPRAAFRPEFDRVPWRKDAKGLKAWQRGQTGYPMVDAGMRELWTTGFMHNRVRMITASFLVKDLLIDWREGEAWFWDCLVDADAAQNAANWQWVAGSGADASPYFRIFNPVTQGEKFDPDGDYVRRWVPELAGLPNKAIHAPWTAKADVLERAGVVLGRDYPHPIVDHGEARTRTLEAYSVVKETAE